MSTPHERPSAAARRQHRLNLIRRGARFALRADQRVIWRAVDRVTDIDPEDLASAGVRGVLVDADATLAPHHERDFSPAVRDWLGSLQGAGLRVAIYSNARDQSALKTLGVPVIQPSPPKPDPAGFRGAVLRLSLRPSQVVMIGDNLITDGAAIDAGLRFIYCRPIAGKERRAHRWVRRAAHLLAFGGCARSASPMK